MVLSGSLPPGLPPAAYAELIAAATAAGVPAVLDTSGDALREGVAAGPAIVKPNLDELAALAGRSAAHARWRDRPVRGDGGRRRAADGRRAGGRGLARPVTGWLP